MTDTLRKRAERQRRREAGYKRVECWLSAKAHNDLQWLIANGCDTSADAIEQALFWLRYSEEGK